MLLTHNQVDDGQDEEQDDHTNGQVALSAPQPSFMESVLINGNISGLKVTVVLFIHVPPLHSLLPHGLLDGAIGTLLRTKHNTMELCQC